MLIILINTTFIYVEHTSTLEDHLLKYGIGQYVIF